MKIKKYKRNRAAFLPTPGDPYINSLWISSFKRFWKDEIDTLYICINSSLKPDVLDYVQNLYEDLGCTVIRYNSWINHGIAIKECLHACKEQYVMLLEDDFYILRAGEVNRLFSIVECAGPRAVASLRASCGKGLHEQIVKKFKLKGQEKLEPNFWPCLFLCDKKFLLHSSQWFDSYNFEAGVYNEDLRWTPPNNESGDTFVKASIELRNMGLQFHLEPQHRNTTDDLKLYEEHKGTLSQDLPWTHFGSSSTSLNGSLLDEDGYALGNKIKMKMALPAMTDDHIREDYERRVALWSLCHEAFQIPDSGPAYFNKIYGNAIQKLIDGCSLSQDKINRFKDIYKQVLSVLL